MACNLGGNRHPANNEIYVETDEPVAFAQIKLSSIERGLRDIFSKSEMVKSLDRFEMDPATRILNISLTIDYPLESLFNFTQIPQNNISNEHQIELAISFPETKTLAQTRYLGFTFHKFKIDGDDYIDAFEIVAAVAQTILANSELVDYLYKENADKLPEGDHRVVLKEILDQNGIVIFHTTKKINFKLDLSQIAHLSPYVEEYSNLRLWRFSPTLFEGKEVRFKIIAGEGKPTDRWLQSQEARITEDTRTLLQVRNELYMEYGEIENIEINNRAYMQSLISNEAINTQTLPTNYRNEIAQVLTSLSQEAEEILTRNNENFVADPEYEFIQFSEYSKNKMRNFISVLDRRLTIDRNIQEGGLQNSNKKPLITKLVSQNLLNKGMNFLTDLEIDGNQLFTEAEFWLMPQLPGIGLKGKLHLPIEYLMGLMDQNLVGQDYESKITDSQTGFPVELILESRMADNGVLGLDIKKFTIKSGGKKLEFDRNSKNKNFLIDLTKLYLANTLSSLKIEAEDKPENEEEVKKEEIREILSYLNALKNEYTKLRNKEINDLLAKDILFNPIIRAGQEHLERKREILIGQLITYNEQTKLFEMKLDPNIAVDKINNVAHDLQIWSLTPLYSRELNNTFLELSVGHGLRSQKYIDELYFRGGRAENSQFSGIYYELGNERSTVDMLFSLNLGYLKYYINNFLAEMVQHNQTNIEAQAEAEKGETFYEIQHLDINISADKKIMLDLKIKSAKYARSWRNWFSRVLKTDTYSISSELKLESKMINIGANNALSNLKYYPQAISVVPTKVNIKSGSPSVINQALTAIVNRGANLVLNNGTFKKLLLKIVTRSLSKMYAATDAAMIGNPMEKIARLQTTNQDILIFLNPKLSGPAFDVHLSNDEDRIGKAIKLDTMNQMMHVAFTSGAAMAKNDKKALLKLVRKANELMTEVKAANTKEDLEKVLQDQQLIGKLITNSDAEKKSVYNHFAEILRKYDQVLHTVNIPHQNELERTRISASGSELMYFAGVAHKLSKELAILLEKMERFQLTSRNHYYPSFKEAHDKIQKNIYQPLIEQYERKNHRINQTILNSKISYWTYQIYPDSFLAEEIYSLIK